MSGGFGATSTFSLGLEWGSTGAHPRRADGKYTELGRQNVGEGAGTEHDVAAVSVGSVRHSSL